MQAAFNEEVTKRTVGGVLSTERDKVMQDVRSRLADDAKSFGIEILDVRIKRVDFVANITESIYSRMASERKQVANQLRSTGARRGREDPRRRRPAARGDRRRGVPRRAEGQGRGRRQGVGAVRRAFGRDPQFAQFYRSLEAYRASFRSKSDVMVVDPSSEFFKAMRGSVRRRARPRRRAK